jgi:hypothetical protein
MGLLNFSVRSAITLDTFDLNIITRTAPRGAIFKATRNNLRGKELTPRLFRLHHQLKK